jgi:hypothetical protein
MGPMMMPPMRGGGEGSEADNKQLYRERKLKVVAPANSEPVKNRREGRAKRHKCQEIENLISVTMRLLNSCCLFRFR